jgi:hypothetical protein
MADETSNATFSTSEIEEIHEIADFYFLRVRGGTGIIVSKQKADNPAAIKHAIESLVRSRGIKHTIELDWKWK